MVEIHLALRVGRIGFLVYTSLTTDEVCGHGQKSFNFSGPRFFICRQGRGYVFRHVPQKAQEFEDLVDLFTAVCLNMW